MFTQNPKLTLCLDYMHFSSEILSILMSLDDWKLCDLCYLKILSFVFEDIVSFSIRFPIDLTPCTTPAKTKALISFAVTAKLICAFVFAYRDCWFYHVAAQFW